MGGGGVMPGEFLIALVRVHMYVYIMRAGDKCKIGKASNPERRLAELQTGNPQRIRLLACIPCKSEKHALELERVAHRLFRHDGMRGEWFHFSRRLRRFVETARMAADESEQARRLGQQLDKQFLAVMEGTR